MAKDYILTLYLKQQFLRSSTTSFFALKELKDIGTSDTIKGANLFIYLTVPGMKPRPRVVGTHHQVATSPVSF